MWRLDVDVWDALTSERPAVGDGDTLRPSVDVISICGLFNQVAAAHMAP